MPIKKAAAKKAATKKPSTKPSDAEQVAAYMQALDSPLKAEIEVVRTIIKGAHPAIAERIKWNAPSYHYKGEDMVTFHTRSPQHVHLVFHHPSIESIPSTILEGDYKGRRMAYFPDMASIKANKKELIRVMLELVQVIDGKG